MESIITRSTITRDRLIWLVLLAELELEKKDLVLVAGMDLERVLELERKDSDQNHLMQVVDLLLKREKVMQAMDLEKEPELERKDSK